MTVINGASVWEQQLYDHLTRHGKNEGEILAAYEQLANDAESPAFAFLAELILDDERRHHQLLDALATTIRTTAELTGQPVPIPHLGVVTADRERILAATERLLAFEEQDDRELDALAKELKDVRNTTLWELVVRLMQQDNEKHRRILKFIRDRALESG